MRRLAAAVIALGLTSCDNDPSSRPAPPLAMLGDSIIAMMAPQQPQLPAPFNNALNLGVSGQTTALIKKQVAAIPAGTPVVLVEGGINNFVFGRLPSTIADDYAEMLRAIPAATRVVVLGIIQVDPSAYSAEHQNWKTAFSNEQIAAANAAIDALCAQYSNCEVATAAQKLSMVGLTLDGLHPNPAGYAALMAAIVPVINAR